MKTYFSTFRALLLALSLFYNPLTATDLQNYLHFLEKSSWSKGNAAKGEIEIITKEDLIKDIESKRFFDLCKSGLSEEEAYRSSRVGIVSEDMYWTWVRDAVAFPNGKTGTYVRLIWKGSDKNTCSGGVVFPIDPEGKILLLLNYRHATRSWEWEFPRGAKEVGENMESAILRELEEESGWIAEKVEKLGELTPDTSTEGQAVPIYLAKLTQKGKIDQEGTEAVQGSYAFSPEEIYEGLQKGFLEIEGQKHPFRGSYETYGILQAILQGYLPLPKN